MTGSLFHGFWNKPHKIGYFLIPYIQQIFPGFCWSLIFCFTHQFTKCLGHLISETLLVSEEKTYPLKSSPQKIIPFGTKKPKQNTATVFFRNHKNAIYVNLCPSETSGNPTNDQLLITWVQAPIIGSQAGFYEG